MITLTVRTNGDKLIDMVSDNDIHDLLNLLENHPDVKDYKIILPNVGVLSAKDIQYNYGGYHKAVSGFMWNVKD